MKKSLPILLAALAVIVAWVAWWFQGEWLASQVKHPNAGIFGDMFGALNTLFTGLALVGLIYNAALQQKQIREARETTDQALRPWISFRLAHELYSRPKVGDNVRLNVVGHYENHGDSPAQNIQFQLGLTHVYDGLDSDNFLNGASCVNVSDHGRLDIAFPNEGIQKLPAQTFVTIPEKTLDAAHDKGIPMFLCGWLRYESPHIKGKVGMTKLCYKVFMFAEFNPDVDQAEYGFLPANGTFVLGESHFSAT